MKTLRVGRLFDRWQRWFSRTDEREIEALRATLLKIMKEGPDKALIEYLYDCLSILDDKSSSLLSFNSIIMAVFAIFMTVQDVDGLQIVLIGIGTTCVLVSSFLLLNVVHIRWSSSVDLDKIEDHQRALLRIRGERTNEYQRARLLAVVSVALLAAFFLMRIAVSTSQPGLDVDAAPSQRDLGAVVSACEARYHSTVFSSPCANVTEGS